MEIYLDNSATTRLDTRVLEKMFQFGAEYGNPSSVHKKGQIVRVHVEKMRENIANMLGFESKNLIFTSSGSESNNSAIRGVVKKGDHVLTSAIEHSSVLETLKVLQKDGIIELDFIPVTQGGAIDLEKVPSLIKENTRLVSVMHANNETGVIQPIFNLKKMLRYDILLHIDAVQTIGKIKENPFRIADLCTISPHKFYGPKGIGGLVITDRVPYTKLIHGGSQERSKRAGTENILGIVGFHAALEIVLNEPEAEKTTKLREQFEKMVTSSIPGAKINGEGERRLPGISNISFEKVSNDVVLFNLDMENIYASAGSACSSGSIDLSHVLRAMDIPSDLQKGAVRFSFGKYNNSSEVEETTQKLKHIIERLRKKCLK